MEIAKLLFSEKVTAHENIMSVDNNNIFSTEIAEKLYTFFSNVVKELKIKIKEHVFCDISNINDPVERKSYSEIKNHPSIPMIKETFDND